MFGAGDFGFTEIISGARRGPLATALRGTLAAAEPIYAAAVSWRNRRYDRGRADVHRANACVLSVGNLTVGGTGKTPMVEHLARWFGERGAKVAIVSRGYGTRDGQPNDEALELAQKLPGVPHEQSSDRVAAAQTAVSKYSSELLILDDGFQHRRLWRDLDLVMLDATCPFGYGHLLPRGLLRESVSSLSRAQVVVLSHSNLVDSAAREEIRRSVACYAPNAVWVETVHSPRRMYDASGRQWPAVWLRGRRVAAFCGLGNPAPFRRTLQNAGAHIVGIRAFADHHQYTSDEVTALLAWAKDLTADALVCTCKDLVKLPQENVSGVTLAALEIGLEVTAGAAELEATLQTLLARVGGSQHKGHAPTTSHAKRRSA